MKVRDGAVMALTFGAMLVFGGVLVHAALWDPQPEAQAPVAVSTSTPRYGPPLRLRIPSLSVDARVQDVGLTSLGNMGVPNNFTDVAWYKYGPAPGERGSAAIDGHVDNGLGLPGVFKHLNAIRAGDEVDIDTASSTLRFAVTDVESYPYKEVPMDRILSRTDGAFITLITCDGGWVAGDRTYDHRLVVTAKLLSA